MYGSDGPGGGSGGPGGVSGGPSWGSEIGQLGSYRHHLLTHKRNGLGEGFESFWGWIWMVLREFKMVFLMFWTFGSIEPNPPLEPKGALLPLGQCTGGGNFFFRLP